MTEETQGNTSNESGGEAPSKDNRTMAMLAHLLGIITSFLGPLIIWLIKKDESSFVDDQGKEALNFQITVCIVYVLLIILSCLTLGLAIPLFFVLFVVDAVFGIMAGVAANNGDQYRYPVSIRLIK